MADDSLRHALGLISRCAGHTVLISGLQQVQREHPAEELETQLGIHVFGGGADIVEHTCQVVGLVREVPVGEGEAVAFDGEAVVVDATRMVVDWFGEVRERVCVDALRQLGGGDGRFSDGDWVWEGVEPGVN